MPDAVTSSASSAPATRVILPARRVHGVTTPPPDKSIAHRALILSALATGRSTIAPPPIGDDVAATARCLEHLGVRIERGEREWTLEGVGPAGLTAPDDELDCGNSGTTMRLLAGVLVGARIAACLVGDESLTARPMMRIVEPLREMGADIEASPEGAAPLRIHPAPLRPIEYTLPVASAQVKSAIMLAALAADSGPTTIGEPVHTRDHTERMLTAAGATVTVTARERHIDRREQLLSDEGGADEPRRPFIRRIVVEPCAELKPMDWRVPGDFSAAAYFIAAALGAADAQLTIRECGLNATRTGMLKVLKRMGATLEVTRTDAHEVEPRGNIKLTSAELKGVKIGGGEIPTVIDELPLLAVLAARARGVTVIRGADELRHKESDRLKSTADNLRNMGAKVGELEDGWAIEGPTEWHAATIDPAGDHRIAMAFAVAALWADGDSTITDADVVRVSNPEFFETLAALTQ